jgi:hypothetical protein
VTSLAGIGETPQCTGQVLDDEYNDEYSDEYSG